MPLTLSFDEAKAALAAKRVQPTALTSAQLRAVDASVRRQSFFSAQTLLSDLLEGYKMRIASIVSPETIRDLARATADNPEGLTTIGMDPAKARVEIKNLLRGLGYKPDEDTRGTLRDLSSDARINLVIETNTQMAQGAGQLIQGNNSAVRQAFPCYEYLRFEARVMERDWPTRFRIAAQVANDVDAARVLDETGRMIARKDSALWQELGDGAGGYDDTLGNPFPPFAYGTGMFWLERDWDTCADLGLVNEDTVIAPALIDFANLFGTEIA